MGTGEADTRHFVLEALLGAIRSVAAAFGLDVVPERVWFIRCGQEPSWRDSRGDSEWP